MKRYAPKGRDVESAYKYVDGGFHPVNIGDVYNDRYCVIRKLGYGSYSTICLVEDVSLKHIASLKVVAARWGSGGSEANIATHLKSLRDVTHPGREHVVQIFDTFIINGPNGTHHCIVTEVLGISRSTEIGKFGNDYRRPFRTSDAGLEMLRQTLWPFSMDTTKKMVAQVALGVSYLHKCGVIHGDLHLGNVLLYNPALQTACSKQLDEIYGRQECKPILYEDGTINYFLNQICDFGEASIIGSRAHDRIPFVSHTPRVFAAPEILFKDISYPTTSIDIWALGVILHMIINYRQPPFNSDYEDNNEIIAWMVHYLGKLPDKWWVKWADRTDFFDDKDIPYPEEIDGIDSRLEFSQDERKLFSHVLRKIFHYKPEERIDAEEIVRLLPPGWVGSQVLGKLNGTF